jgi:hypothetical protein
VKVDSKKNGPTPKLHPSRMQAFMVGGSGGVKKIDGQDYFSFVVAIPGGTCEVLWPFDSTPAVIEAIKGSYDDAIRNGVAIGESPVVMPDPKQVVDLGSKRRG